MKRFLCFFAVIAFGILILIFEENIKKDQSHELAQKQSMYQKLLDIRKEELVWEMGNAAPEPKDFFELSEEDSIWVNSMNLVFENSYDSEILKKRGRYVVKVESIAGEIECHLFVNDTTPPQIKAPQQITYNIGDTILYKKDVVVSDNSGENIELLVDTSEVKSNMAGKYPVHYSAMDSAGNVSNIDVWLIINKQHIPTEDDIKKLADQVLEQIIREDMSKYEKAFAIFTWCNKNICYTADAEKDSIVDGAYDGLYYMRGDCYTYFATAAYLMDICEIDNLPVSRKTNRGTHYWSLVNTGSGWYHFDCSPQKDYYLCFMQTDEQVQNYCKRIGKENLYQFNHTDGMPEISTTIIYENKKG